MKITLKRLSLCLASVGMLTIYGCGGGGDTVATPSTSTRFAPSLGQFSVGTVFTVNKLDGTLLSTGTIGANGSVTLSVSNDVYPVIVTVAGAAGVTYFDEGSNKWESFTTGSLRAVVPTPMAEVGVTPLTNAAVANLEARGTLASATAQTITDANLKIATVFGLIDILTAPTPVNNTTSASLDLALHADKYALVLAALAKAATGGDTAATLATKLANDLSDNKLDGRVGTTPISGYTLDPTTLATAYQTMAATLATPTSAFLAAKQPLVVTSDVTAVVAVTNQSDVTLAKDMFAELRTTLSSVANGSTGFLDTQATRMNDDLSANVTPEMTTVADRLSVLSETMGAFDDAKTNSNGFTSGVIPGTSTPALVRITGSLTAVWFGAGSYDSCWTDSVTPLAITTITCYHAGKNAADYGNHRIKMVAYALTATAANQYDYTATRRNKNVTLDVNSQPVFASGTTLASGVPAGSGTVAQTFSGNTMTGLTLNGTLPPSTTSTGVDTIAISAARTALPANTFHYALSGSVSTSKTLTDGTVDTTKVTTLSFDSGSYFDLDESNVNTGNKLLAAKLIGTAKTLATQFTGSVTLGSFLTDADGINYTPTSVEFNGSISDTSGSGAGEILTGKLEATVASYDQFHSTQPETSNNYEHATVTFTGTVQAPSRPLLKLIVAGTKTGVTTSALTVNYSYGTVSLTGSGVIDNANQASKTLTLSNQAGIQTIFANGVPAVVKKSGVTLATITNGNISYIDGVSESLN